MPHTGSLRSVGDAGTVGGVWLLWCWCVLMSMGLLLVVLCATGCLRVPIMSSMTISMHQVHQWAGQQQQIGPEAHNMAPVLSQQVEARDQGSRCQRHAGRAPPERRHMGFVMVVVHGVWCSVA